MEALTITGWNDPRSATTPIKYVDISSRVPPRYQQGRLRLRLPRVRTYRRARKKKSLSSSRTPMSQLRKR
jgi:hypothetical protein